MRGCSTPGQARAANSGSKLPHSTCAAAPGERSEWRHPREVLRRPISRARLAVDPGVLPCVPALRAKANARDTSLGMTATSTERLFAGGGWRAGSQVLSPGTIYRAPTKKRRGKWWRGLALPGGVRQGGDDQIVTEVLFRLRVALCRIWSAGMTDRPTANAIGSAFITILR